MRAVIQCEELVMGDPTKQQQSGEYEQCAQQDRFLAQIANQSLEGRGACVCNLYHQKYPGSESWRNYHAVVAGVATAASLDLWSG